MERKIAYPAFLEVFRLKKHPGEKGDEAVFFLFAVIFANMASCALKNEGGIDTEGGQGVLSCGI